jgi:hypothetical protein
VGDSAQIADYLLPGWLADSSCGGAQIICSVACLIGGKVWRTAVLGGKVWRTAEAGGVLTTFVRAAHSPVVP